MYCSRDQQINVMATWYMTMDEVLALYDKAGFYLMPYKDSVTIVSNMDLSNACLAFAISDGVAKGRYSNFYDMSKLPAVCELSGNTNIDHRMLSDNALNGAWSSARISLKCTGEPKVLVKASRTNFNGVRLRSDGSLYSEVTINGQNAISGINVSIIDNVSTPLTILSALKTTGLSL